MSENKEVWWCDFLFQAFQKMYFTSYKSEISIVGIIIPESSKAPSGSIDYMVECSSGLLADTDIIRVQINIMRTNTFYVDVQNLTSNSVILHFQDLMTNNAKLILINKEVLNRSYIKSKGPFVKLERDRFKYNRRKLEFGAWFPMMGNTILRGVAKHIGNTARDLKLRATNKTLFPSI